jgi:hypothetical protein
VSPISTASPQLCWASSPHGDLTLTGLRGWVVAAVVTALPFAGVYVPLLFLDDQVSPLSVLRGITGTVDLGHCASAADGCHVARRLRQRVSSRGLASDLRCQQQQRRPGRSLLDGADAGDMTQLAAAVLTVLVAAWLLWRRPGTFARRHIPPQDSAREVR